MAKLHMDAILLDLYEQKEKGRNYLTLLDVGTGGQIKLTTTVKPNVGIGEGALVDVEVKPRIATQGGGTFLEVTGGVGIKPRVPSKP
jgi:hypothetical protein